MWCHIIIHQGIGDLFNSIGIINYYTTKYDKVYVLVINKLNKDIIDNIFFEINNKVKAIIPDFTYINKSNETCIICMTNGCKTICPRERIQKCKYIKYNHYENIIKIGSFKNYIEWENFKNKSFSFADAFYLYANLEPNIRFTNFKIFNNKKIETDVYNEFVKKYGLKYILIHEDQERNRLIRRNKISDNNLPIINLNKISLLFVDYIKIIENAQEIHLIDSSWSVLIYLLSYNNLNAKVFLNESDAKLINRDINIYKNPVFNNWTFY
jgi:hypothetical protein